MKCVLLKVSSKSTGGHGGILTKRVAATVESDLLTTYCIHTGIQNTCQKLKVLIRLLLSSNSGKLLL